MFISIETLNSIFEHFLPGKLSCVFDCVRYTLLLRLLEGKEISNKQFRGISVWVSASIRLSNWRTMRINKNDWFVLCHLIILILILLNLILFFSVHFTVTVYCQCHVCTYDDILIMTLFSNTTRSTECQSITNHSSWSFIFMFHCVFQPFQCDIHRYILILLTISQVFMTNKLRGDYSKFKHFRMQLIVNAFRLSERKGYQMVRETGNA